MPYRTRIFEVTAFSRVLPTLPPSASNIQDNLAAATPVVQPRLPLTTLASILFSLAAMPAAPLFAQQQAQQQAAQPQTAQQVTPATALPLASDLDWVTLDKLSPEQQAQVSGSCCGLYIEPPLPVVKEAAGSTVILGTSVDGAIDGIIAIANGMQILQEDAWITAAQGNYDQKKQVFTLLNDIRIRQPGLLMTGTAAVVDEAEARSEISSASYLMHESGIRGSADVIVYTDAQGIITIDNGVFTRCEPGDNSWLIAGKEIVLDQSTGRGTARAVTLSVQDVPVLYLPWVSFPINDERATGFLAPVMGSTRDGGIDIATPYYLNLAPNYDMTLTPRIQSKRGAMLGIEGRYLGRRNEQVLDLQFLPGDNLYDEATRLVPGADSPPVDDRWLLDYKMRGQLQAGWSATADYAAVSDEEYFQDLGSNGLVSTSRSLLQRDARLNYRGTYWDFTASTQAFQVIDPSITAFAEPYRKLPSLDLRGSFYSDWGLEYGVDTEYVLFDRNLNHDNFTQPQIDSGALVTGSRLAFTPMVSLPWSNNYAFATPTLKYKYASWNLDDAALGNDSSPSRGISSASFDSGLIFERAMDFFGDNLRQTLEPRLFYLYNEYEDQSDIPLFDSSDLTFSYNQLFRDDRFSGKDRVSDANQLTLAVSSRFYDTKGQERARASLGQIQYFTNRRVSLLNVPGVVEDEASSALVGEFSVNLGQHWRAGSYLEWNPDTSDMDVGNFQFQYQSDINRILNFGYRYREVPGPTTFNGIERKIDQIDVSGIWPLTSEWGLIARWNHDIANDRNLETLAGVEYNNCCWTVRVLARQWIDNNALFQGIEDDNTGIFIQFELKGLGSVLGGNVSGILNNGISGYRERDYVQ